MTSISTSAASFGSTAWAVLRAWGDPREELRIDSIHRLEIGDVLQEDGRLDDPVHARARSGEHGGKILQRPLGLCLHIALDLVGRRVAADLTGCEDEPARLDRLRVRASSGRGILR